MNSEKSSRFQELDALRGIAALMVVIFHFTRGKVGEDSILNFGTTGVDLFFIISGFVIFMSLTRVKRGIDFVINRFSRLFPTYWTVVSFTFILILLKTFLDNQPIEMSLVGQYLANMTMFQFYMRIPNLDGPYWTMIVEMLFYIIILVFFQLKLLKWLNTAGVAVILFILLGAHFAFENMAVRALVYGIPLLQFLPLFLAGTVFYKLHISKDGLVGKTLLLLFCLVSQVLLYHIAGSSLNYISQAEYGLMLTVYFGLFGLFITDHLSFIVSRPSLFLGKISYALYLVHQFVSTRLIIPYFHNELGLNFWIVAIFIALPVVIGLAAIITFMIEVPLSAKMKAKLRLLAS
ncbi:MAG: acyltransferase [Flavobacteriales bacterium]|nr:acyltransferase [Flavobacteriales bacterium]